MNIDNNPYSSDKTKVYSPINLVDKNNGLEKTEKVSAECLSKIPVLSGNEAVDHTLFSDEKILEESYLHSLELSPPPFEPELLLRCAGNFLGGGLITGGKGKTEKLDGMEWLTNFQLWEWLFKQILSSNNSEVCPLMEKLLHGIHQLKAFSEEVKDLQNSRSDEEKLYQFASKYTKKIHDLSPGQSILVPTGWVNIGGGTGHAILCEFQRNSNTTYNIYVYTSTGYQLADLLLAKEKIRKQSVIRYENVPEKLVCFNNQNQIQPVLIQHLMELDILACWNPDWTFKEEDLLQVFDYIEPYRLPADWNRETGITGQRGGTCAPSSTKVWMRHMAGQIRPYKQVIFLSDLYLLVGTYRALQSTITQDTASGHTARRLLELESRNLLRRTEKALKNELISEETSTSTQATLFHLLKNVMENERSIIEKRRSESHTLDLYGLSTERQQTDRKTSLASLSPTKPKKQSEFPCAKLPNFPRISTIQDFYAATENFIKRYDSWSSVYSKMMAFNLELHHIVDQLPIKDSNHFWSENLSKEEIEKTLSYFNLLITKYETSFRVDSPTRTHATILSLHTLTHYLARRLSKKDGGLLEKFKINDLALTGTAFESLTYYDIKEYERIQEVVDYINDFQGNLNAPTLFSSEESTGVEKYEVAKAPGNGIFWEKLVESDSQLKKELKIAYTKLGYEWQDVSDEKIKKEFNGERVNLPWSTKATLILESSISCDHTNPLVRCGYLYVVILRRMTFHCKRLLNTTYLHEAFEITPKRSNPNSYKVVLEKKGSCEKISYSKPKDVLNKQHRSLHSDHERLFKHQHLLRNRVKERGVAEARALKESPKEKKLQEKLKRISFEPQLTPFQLIHEFNNNLEAFNDPSLQSTFIRLFFRSTVRKDSSFDLGTGKNIIDDEALLSLCKNFVQKGIQYYFRKKEGKVQGARFFFELAFFLSKYLKESGNHSKAKQLDMLDHLNHWIEEPNLNDQERAVIHLYRALFYTLSNPKDLNKEDLVKLFTSSIFYHFYPDDGKWKSEQLLFFLSQFLYEVMVDLSEKLSHEDGELAGFLGRGVIQSLGFCKSFKGVMWSYDPKAHVLKSSCEDPDKEWIFDFTEGKIFNRSGRIGTGNADHPWERQTDFKRLFFWERAFSYVPLGDDNYSFFSPEFGAFRLIKKEYGDYAIQRQFSTLNHQWFEYQPVINLEGFPSILAYDHAYWIPVNKQETKYTGYFTTLRGFRLEYATTSEGEIAKVNHTTGVSKTQPQTVDFVDSDDLPEKVAGISTFDTHQNCLLYNDPESQKLLKVSFPRYASQEGNRLIWVNVEGRLLWSENRQYALATQTPKGFLGSIPNYLYLEPQKEGLKPKILVPFQPLNDKYEIDIENEDKLISHQNEQWGVFHYFVYDVVNHEVAPTTIEAQLYLAYLYASEKKYVEAVELIKGVKPTETLTEIGFCILELFEQFSPQEDHPDGVAVYLHAIVLKMRQIEKKATNKEPILKSEKRIWHTLYSIRNYLQSMNNVSSLCRISCKEEKKLISRLLKQSKSWDFQYWLEKNGLLGSYRVIENHLKNRVSFLKKKTDSGIKPIKKKRGLPYNSTYSWESSCISLPNDSDEERLKEAVKWLDSGSLSLLCSRPNNEIEVQKNGRMLLEACHIGKKGSMDERRAIVYRLQQWRMRTENRDDRFYIDLMISTLIFPAKFPDPIDPAQADLAEKSQFITSLENGFEGVNTDQIRRFLLPSNLPKMVPPKEFKPHEAPRGVSDAEEEIFLPINIQIPQNDQRWKTLEEWKAKYLKRVDNRPSDSGEDFSFLYDDSMILDSEKDYEATLKRDLSILQDDYTIGKQQNERRVFWSINDDSTSKLLKEVQSLVKHLESELSNEKRILLVKANKQPTDPIMRQINVARIGGLLQRAHTYDDCLICLLSGNQKDYQKMNPTLTSNEVTEIAESTLKILEIKSYISQLSRIRDLCGKLSLKGDESREYHCLKLADELDSKYFFSSLKELQQQIVLRVFAGEIGILPHEKQMNLIKRMLEAAENDPTTFRDIVIQLIMGGGKTTVLALILLYLAAQNKDRLALFVVPPSLFKVIEENLSTTMLKAFRKVIQSLDVSRDELSLYRLRKIHKQMTQAQKNREPVVVKALSLQCLQLEFFAQSIAFAKTKEGKESLVLLAKLCRMFAKSGDALLDEIDLLLYSLQEVNFPSGETKKIRACENALIHEIFKLLVDSKLEVKTLNGSPKVVDIVRVEENMQDLMPTEVFSKHVVPVIVRALADYLPIKEYTASFQESFIRYASDQIPPIIQSYADHGQVSLSESFLNEDFPEWENYGSIEQLECDLAFMKHLGELANSEDEKDKDGADLIALAKHLLVDVLPATLKKSGKKDYGPSPDVSSSEVIPFLGVNTPATTKFGYLFEAACYYYQWITSFVMTEEHIKKIAQDAEISALYYVEKNEELFEETAEYREFFNLFGITLYEAKDPEKLKLAVKACSEDVLKRLSIQREVVNQNVSTTTERLSSNGMNMLRQVRSRRAMSGTPWNVEGYPKSLASNYVSDAGTEGKILHTMAKRHSPIHEVKFQTISELMDQVLTNHPTPNKVRGIIEAGGIFKVFNNNADVAEQLLKYITAKQKEGMLDDTIHAVLFFHNAPGQAQPDTLYVWKRGAKHPDRIQGTTKEVLEAKGLDPAHYFVYIDERHHTGVDIPQAPGVINLLTYNVEMLRRTLGQGTMRLRQFLFSQNMEMIITSETRKLLVHQGKELDDLILSAEKNQSILTTEEVKRLFTQQISDLYRYHTSEELLDLALSLETQSNSKEFVSAVLNLKPFFVSKMPDRLFPVLGRLSPKEGSKHLLLKELDHKMELFKTSSTNGKRIRNVQNEFDKLKKSIWTANNLPQFGSSRLQHLGVQQEVEVQVEVTKEVEVNFEVETEIELELQKYEAAPYYSLLNEPKLSEDRLRATIKDLRQGRGLSLKEQLQEYSYGTNNQKVAFESAFVEPIFGTQAFFRSCERDILPFFHRLQKPPKQALAVLQGGRINWLLLSEREAYSAKKHLRHLYDKHPEQYDNVWLLQADGSLLINGEHLSEFPIEEDNAQAGLLEINALGGNAEYLAHHPYEADHWLKENFDIKIHFLKLATARDKRQNQALRSNPLVQKLDSNPTKQLDVHQFSLRVEEEKNQQGRLKPDPEEVRRLSPKKVRDLNVNFVRYLGVGLSQIDAKTKEHIQKQFEALNSFQVPFLLPEQMKWLPLSAVQYLNQPEQIAKLSREQAKKLTKQQSHLIPFLNPEYFQDLTLPWQIQSIPIEFLDRVQGQHLKHLTKEQMSALFLKKKDLFDKLSTENKYQWIHGDLLKHIPKEHLVEVTQDQIRQISDPKVVGELETIAKEGNVEEGLWTSWLAPKMVAYLDFDRQLKFLKKEQQIRKIPLDQISKLDPKTQVPLIDSYQVKYLTPEQIPFCPLKLVPHLKINQVVHISTDQVPHLRGEEQIRAIRDSELFSRLNTEESDEQINQLVWINEEQIPLVCPHQVKGIPDQYLPKINPKQVSGLSHRQLLKLKKIHTDEQWKPLQDCITPEQIGSFNSRELIELLTQEQINTSITETQISLLSHAQLLSLKEAKTDDEWKPFQNGITQEMITSFDSTELFELLTQKQIGDFVSENQLSLLTKPWQVEACPKKYFMLLDDNQFSHLSRKQIAEMDTIQEFKRLSPSQFEQVSPKHIGRLSNHLITQLQQDPHTMQLVKFFPSDKLHLVKNQKAVGYLSEKQISEIKPEMMNRISYQHPLWGRINSVTIQGLTVDKIQFLSDSQLRYLQRDDHIQAVSALRVHHLTNEQKERRTNFQYYLRDSCERTTMTIALGTMAIALFSFK